MSSCKSIPWRARRLRPGPLRGDRPRSPAPSARGGVPKTIKCRRRRRHLRAPIDGFFFPIIDDHIFYTRIITKKKRPRAFFFRRATRPGGRGTSFFFFCSRFPVLRDLCFLRPRLRPPRRSHRPPRTRSTAWTLPNRWPLCVYWKKKKKINTFVTIRCTLEIDWNKFFLFLFHIFSLQNRNVFIIRPVNYPTTIPNLT